MRVNVWAGLDLWDFAVSGATTGSSGKLSLPVSQ